MPEPTRIGQTLLEKYPDLFDAAKFTPEPVIVPEEIEDIIAQGVNRDNLTTAQTQFKNLYKKNSRVFLDRIANGLFATNTKGYDFESNGLEYNLGVKMLNYLVDDVFGSRAKQIDSLPTMPMKKNPHLLAFGVESYDMVKDINSLVAILSSDRLAPYRKLSRHNEYDNELLSSAEGHWMSKSFKKLERYQTQKNGISRA